jgi:hypothetical protein
MMGTDYTGNKYIVYDYSLIWSLEFAWLPTRCHRSGKFIWFKNAYKGVHKLTGPGYNIDVTVWHNPYEHMKFILESV